ncbi:MAG: response regulator transcription factor [Chloroflexi bacterium]|nr:response regulator transcription factor [Chloroflexota bacterium]
MKIMLVDDQPLFRNGVASLLRAKGHQVVAEAANGQEALETLQHVCPDLILMDIQMPAMGGLEATRHIKAHYPEAKIVILTVSDEEQDLFDAIKSGASSYLLKDLEALEFFAALEAIQEGEAVLPSRLAGKLLEEFRSQALRAGVPQLEPILSLREQEVLGLVAQGFANKEVADRLGVTENTAKYHMKNILGKLHLQNRAQVVAWAARHGIPPGPL